MNFVAAQTIASASGPSRSSRRSLPISVVCLFAVSLVGCASRPETGFLNPVVVSSPGAIDHTLLVATTRERDPRPGTLFNGDRASAIDYAEITVSVPPTHKDSEIEWATTPPGDPNANFVVRSEDYLGGDRAFVQALNSELARRPPGKRKVLLFIHGFNTMFAEGLYRLTQIAHDAKVAGRPGAVHLGVARQACRLCLRHKQRHCGARRTRTHAAPPLGQQGRRGQCARPLDGQLGHGRGVSADQDFRQPRSHQQARLCVLRLPISTSTCSSRR